MADIQTWENFELALPHPYYNTYQIQKSQNGDSLQLLPINSLKRNSATLSESLHNSDIYFSQLSQGDEVKQGNNTAWARARRAPVSKLRWSGSIAPTVGQLWLIIYAIISLQPEEEYFRLQLDGTKAEALTRDLAAVGLATEHPEAPADGSSSVTNEVLVLRGMFWQGAGSPFGRRAIWAPETNNLQTSNSQLSSFPPLPLDYTFSLKFPESRVYARHPVRPAKPTPGSTIYSRYIPHLDEHFSMVALDYENAEHLGLFHTWQNDPRVAQGWNETGTLDQHREYLRNLHNDNHTLTILAKFEDTYFAYFEVYWAKEDTLGAYFDAHDYERGRHSLVGDTRFRGPHRVSAWWSSLMHYMFLDEPRTPCLVGEPKATNSKVLSYDYAHGFHIEKFVDFPHKRSAFVRCERERFFQICPLAYDQARLEEAEKTHASLRGSKL